jgi:putative peptide zinc metalloprotease protein
LENPKLKELEIFPFAGEFYHVHDPANSRHFKLGAEEISWLQLIDGTRTVEELRLLIPHEHFDDFFGLLNRLALLEGTAPPKKFEPMKIKFRTFRPNGWLERNKTATVLYRQLLSVFTVPLLAINVLLLVVEWPQLQQGFTHLRFGWATVGVYLASLLILGFAHEFSHALVAKSRGANVAAIGFMLFYFTPAFYADVSGIALLNNRAHRIETLFAGIQANNVLVTVFFFLFFLAHGTALASFLVLPIALNALVMVWNLVPFVEFDGYYILTELFGEPNFGMNSRRVVLERAYRRPEYILYFVLSQIFAISIVLGGVLAVRSIVERFVHWPAIDYVTLALMAVAYVVLNIRNVRNWPAPAAVPA